MAGGLLGAHYMQSLTSGLAAGVEGFFHPAKKVHGGAVGLRYGWGEGKEHICTAKAGR